MRYLKKYKLFESNDNDINFVNDILLDISDDDISIKVSDLNKYSSNSSIKKISILIGEDDEEEDGYSEIFFDLSKYIETLESVNDYLTGEGYSLEFSHFLYFDEDDDCADSFHSSDFNEIKDKLKNINQLKICEIIYKSSELKEDIKVPIELGDTVLGGRFKNKKTVVKKIGKNKKGDITINDKPLLKYRIVKESLEEDVNYYFKHLEDDNFVIQTENDYFRIFKPINQSKLLSSGSLVYSYSNCNPFQWSEISDEISRYVNLLDDSENSEKSIEYVYIVKRESYRRFGSSFHPIRIQISTQSLIDENFDAGKILSFVIGFK
jgi:hypothetical protein